MMNRRIILTCTLLCVITAAFPQSFLWRVSGKGMPSPSYLYGTAHIEDERIFRNDSTLSDALLACDTFDLNRIGLMSSDTALPGKFSKILTINRNANMIRRFVKLARRQTLLCAVKCAHLAGEKGMLARLRKKGYTVEPVPLSRASGTATGEETAGDTPANTENETYPDDIGKADESANESADALPMASGYDWVTYRGKADLIDTGGTRTCNFYLVNRTDSILYLNVHAYGIEVMRAVFTPDSVTFVNKLTQQYYRDTYAPIHRHLQIPVDFQTVQALFNGDTEKLPQGQKLSFEYSAFAPVDSTHSFFTEFVFKELDRVIEVHGKIKVVRLDVPGVTAIRIPEKFERISL